MDPNDVGSRVIEALQNQADQANIFVHNTKIVIQNNSEEIAPTLMTQLIESINADNAVSHYLYFCCLHCLLTSISASPAVDWGPSKDGEPDATKSDTHVAGTKIDEQFANACTRIARQIIDIKDYPTSKVISVSVEFAEFIFAKVREQNFAEQGISAYLIANKGCSSFILAVVNSLLKQYRSGTPLTGMITDEQEAIIQAIVCAKTLISVMKQNEMNKLVSDGIKHQDFKYQQKSLVYYVDASKPLIDLVDNYDKLMHKITSSVKIPLKLAKGPNALYTEPSNAKSHPAGEMVSETSQTEYVQSPKKRMKQPSPSDEHIAKTEIENTILAELKRQVQTGECIIVPITDTYVIFARSEDGVIVGPSGEGTSAVVFYGEQRDQTTTHSDRRGDAIRVPKVSTGNLFQNFENAEICYFEHLQANVIAPQDALSNPNRIGCLNSSILIDDWRTMRIKDADWHPAETDRNVLVAVYMAPGSVPRVGLISPTSIWPKGLRETLRHLGNNNEIYGIIDEHMRENRRVHAGNAGVTVTSSDAAMPPMFIASDGDQKAKRRATGDGLVRLDRGTITATYSGDRASGWFFGLPYMASNWLATDLHRLLSGLVSGVRQDKTDLPVDLTPGLLRSLQQMPLSSWFEMAMHLCRGLGTIHNSLDGKAIYRVHGDVRPANVMFSQTASAVEIKWIDIGLGSLTARERRLWQSRRNSVFYSWERMTHESEENDLVELTTVERDGSKYNQIKFLFRDDNLKKPTPVRLKGGESGSAGRLSLLEKGDRLILGGEYIFEVEALSEFYVEVGRAWEIASGQIPIEVEAEKIFAQRGHKTISEYKILWQWGIASDIYGIGILILYLFYMRGTYAVLHRPGEAHAAGKSFSLDTEEGFTSVVNTIRTDGFLAAFLRSLDSNPLEGEGDALVHFRKKEALFDLDAGHVRCVLPSGERDEGFGDKTISKLSGIVERLCVFAPGLRRVFYGVNSNPAVFTMLIYSTMQAIWRSDEIQRVDLSKLSRDATSGTGREAVEFDTYCPSRVVSDAGGDKLAAGRLVKDIGRVVDHLKAHPNQAHRCNNSSPVVVASSGDRYSRLDELEKEVDVLKREADERRKVVDDLKRVVVALTQTISEVNSDAGMALGDLSHMISANGGARIFESAATRKARAQGLEAVSERLDKVVRITQSDQGQSTSANRDGR